MFARLFAVAGALERGLAANKPCVLEFHTDPEVPPLPPHITREQAQNFMSAIAKGDANRWHMLGESLRDMWNGK